jgi:type II restriction enzyme
MRPALEKNGRPDILIPSEAAYWDAAWPDNKLFIVGLKTTCKDRWRQVLNEGRRVRKKYILTLQQGITSNQLQEMKDAHVSLVVPRPLHAKYPKAWQPSLVDVTTFIELAKRQLS